MLSNMLNRVLLRTSTHRSTGMVLSRFNSTAISSKYRLGNSLGKSLIQLHQPHRNLLAMLHTQSTQQSSAVAVQNGLSDDIIFKGEEEGGEIAISNAATESPKKFSDMDIHPLTKRSIDKVFKYNDMSVVQEAVLSRLPNENDMFVKAKTGTGKTLAFLIAALETVLKDKSAKDIKYFEGTSILIISPTRELASQIATEAEKLTKFLPFQVHCLVGGESKRAQINKLERGRSDIVVATPGRLYDMLSSVRHLKRACENIQVLVLDEADQLIDMGFKEELKRILALVPEKRQTMLYSATISDDIKKNLGNFALSPKYDLIDTVGKDDVSTHLHVKQSALVTPYDSQLQHVQNLLMNHDASKTGKVIVFLPTTKQTKIYAHLLQYLVPDRTIHELHSGKDQRQRVRISNRFRKSNNDILVTSDVSARGVDYPGVSLVLQIGVPATREQYIHRIGRTGRAGREGEGIIVLAPFENEFLKREVADLPIEKLVPPEVGTKDIEVNQRAIKYALKTVDSDYVREVYTGFLGFYASRMITLGKPRSQAIKEAGDFVKGLGIEEVPHLSDRFIQQLGLNDRQPRFERERSQRGRPSNRRNFDRNDNNKRSYDRNDNKRSYGRNDNLKSRFNRYENDDDDFPSRKPKFNKFNNEGSDEFSNRQPRFNKYNGDDNDEFPNRRRRSSRRDNSDFGEKKHRSNRGDFDYVFKNRSN